MEIYHPTNLTRCIQYIHKSIQKNPSDFKIQALNQLVQQALRERVMSQKDNKTTTLEQLTDPLHEFIQETGCDYKLHERVELTIIHAFYHLANNNAGLSLLGQDDIRKLDCGLDLVSSIKKFMDFVELFTKNSFNEADTSVLLLMSRLKPGIEITKKLSDNRRTISTEKKLEDLPKVRSVFREIVRELDLGQGFVFFINYVTQDLPNENGFHHAVLIEVERQENGLYRLRIINTGNGTINEKDIAQSFSHLLLSQFHDDIFLDTLLNTSDNPLQTLPLVNKLRVYLDKKKIPFIYKQETFEFEPQKYGSCGITPIWAWLKLHLTFGPNPNSSLYNTLASSYLKILGKELFDILIDTTKDIDNWRITTEKISNARLKEDELTKIKKHSELLLLVPKLMKTIVVHSKAVGFDWTEKQEK